MLVSKSPCILYVSTFPPRECGIATFSKDLATAMDKEFNPAVKSKILAINDNGTSIYTYPRKVKWQIYESNIENYLERANEINKAEEIKLVNIQHEYGIFGGEYGSYLLPFIELLQKPIVLTMHTILPRPSRQMKNITQAVTKRASKIVVMTKTSARLLEKVYKVDKNKIHIIPHGVHHVPFPSKTLAKKKLNLSGRTVMSTFGMLNPDKGIEYAIKALPEIVSKYPDVLYLVLGATHPVLRRYEGEKYRNMLRKLVSQLKLKEHVKFYDKYLDLDELIDYLKATDIYISPTLNPRQAVSGTISYALSCACPIVATKNQYARDVLNNSRGRLVGFRSSSEIKNAMQEILDDPDMQKEMKKNAYFYSRHMTWQNVALSYFQIFNDLAKIMPRKPGKLPPINLRHTKNLTDSFGIIQFAHHTKPDIHSGYCLDDCARALIAVSQYYKVNKRQDIADLINIYLNFIKFTQKSNGKFHNLVTYQKTFNDQMESEDSFGRAVWALGQVIHNHHIPASVRNKALKIFNKSFNNIDSLQSLRAIAFCLIGLTLIVNDESLKWRNKELLKIIKKLATRMVNSYKRTISAQNDGWFWFEDFLTYSNYKLPEGLIRTYQLIKDEEYKKIALESLKFLVSLTVNKDRFMPIGQDGWYFRGGKRAVFDQQPEDAATAVECFIAFYKITGNIQYKKQAHIAFDWFLGKNHLNQMIYDEATGGCYDGLGKNSINFNQGAESTISYLMARVAMQNI